MEWNGDTEYLSFLEAIDRGIKPACSLMPDLWDIPEKDVDPDQAAFNIMFAVDACRKCPCRVACRALPKREEYTGILGGEIRWHPDEDVLHIRRLTRALVPLMTRRRAWDGVA